MLGGNASSEIGIGIVGAGCANGRYDARETGILEEIQLAARRHTAPGLVVGRMTCLVFAGRLAEVVVQLGSQKPERVDARLGELATLVKAAA